MRSRLSNRCDAGCQGCYTGATPTGAAGEWGLAEWTRAVDALADAGVFHLALGGGESATLPWLGVFGYWKMACIVEGVHARHLRGGHGGGGTSTTDAIATRVETLLDLAAAMATDAGI